MRGRWLLRTVLGVLAVFVLATGLVLATRPGVMSDEGLAVGQAASGVEPERRATPVTLPQLPIPEALPEDPHEPTPQVVLGSVEIPKIGVTAPLQRGMTLTAINRGPGWWPGTAMPGELGNVVVAGHRTTYTKPFNRLNELAPGDQVIFTTNAGRFVYAVRDVIVVPEDWIDIAAQSFAHTATLFACHPPGKATHRIVAKLRLLDADGRPIDSERALPPIDAEAQRTDHTLTVRPRTDASGPADGATTAPAGDPFAGTSG